MRCSVAPEKLSASDAKVLKQLESELQYRQVPRAVALLAEVQAAMYGPKDVEVPAAATPPTSQPLPSRQPDLWTRLPPTPPPAIPPVVTPTVRAPVAARAAAAVSSPAPATTRAAPTMTIDDACKVLKTTASATWESIEQTRRLLVQSASPARTATVSAERRTQARAEARRVNEAHAVLSGQRADGR